jgi:hypothetical protein
VWGLGFLDFAGGGARAFAEFAGRPGDVCLLLGRRIRMSDLAGGHMAAEGCHVMGKIPSDFLDKI